MAAYSCWPIRCADIDSAWTAFARIWGQPNQVFLLMYLSDDLFHFFILRSCASLSCWSCSASSFRLIIAYPSSFSLCRRQITIRIETLQYKGNDCRNHTTIPFLQNRKRKRYRSLKTTRFCSSGTGWFLQAVHTSVLIDEFKTKARSIDDLRVNIKIFYTAIWDNRNWAILSQFSA